MAVITNRPRRSAAHFIDTTAKGNVHVDSQNEKGSPGREHAVRNHYGYGEVVSPPTRSALQVICASATNRDHRLLLAETVVGVNATACTPMCR